MSFVRPRFAFGLLLACWWLGGALAARAQQLPPAYRLQYTLAMPRPESHLFEVSLEIETLAGGPTSAGELLLQMPRWSPGRYAVFDFAQNVQEMRANVGLCVASPVVAAPAANASPAPCSLGVPLEVERVDTQTWRVKTNGADKLTARYKVFADDLSGTFSQLDERHANYNGASLFVYVVGHKQNPVNLRIEAPRGWRVANGRMGGAADRREWQFENYDLLIDTPGEIAPDWTEDKFQVDGKTYHVVVHSLGDEGGKRPALVRDVEKIVRAEVAMWGAPDFDDYTFLIHFAPAARDGDGMEHLTSTQIIEPASLAQAGAAEGALETVAHEFFHVWNVKRLRPAELGPWDFTKPLNTRALWIAEGLTNYYGSMMMRRSGIWDDRKLLDAFSNTITRVDNSPGVRLMSAEESSIVAPLIDGAAHAQNTNLRETAINYYTKGEILGLTLDLLVRRASGGARSLDDVMRRMYETHYVNAASDSYYLKGRGYTVEDFARATSEVAGADMSYFFKRHARGVEPPPYEEAFAYVGLKLTGENKTTNGAAPLTIYRLKEIDDATREARAARRAWLLGRMKDSRKDEG